MGRFFLGCRGDGYTALKKGRSIAVRRFARASEEERMRRRFGGGWSWVKGWSGEPGGVFNRSCNDSRRAHTSVERTLEVSLSKKLGGTWDQSPSQGILSTPSTYHRFPSTPRAPFS
jgi:hypothetical protein